MRSSQWLKALGSIGLALALISGTALAQAKSAAKVSSKSKTTASKTSSKTSTTKKRKTSHTKARRPRGQQAISAERTTEIQQALIREKYLDGDPTGIWDERTKDAMARYQGDNGWQTKMLPDARALIKLGLGPDHSNLINPDSAITHPSTLTSANRQ